MATNTMVFPKEFERHFLKDLDKELLGIIVVLYSICLIGCTVMSQIDLNITEQDISIPGLPPVTVPTNVEVTKQMSTPEPKAPVTVSDAGEATGGKGGTGGADHGAVLGNVKAGAAKGYAAVGAVGVFRQAGGGGGGGGGGFGGGGGGFGGGAGMGGYGSGGGGGGYGVAGLGGTGSGADLSKLNVLGTGAREAAMAQKLGPGGKYVAQAAAGGKLRLTDLKPEDIDAIVRKAQVRVSNAPGISGAQKATSAKGRAAADIQSKVSGYSNQIKTCFQTFLRRDPNLAGEVRFAFTIKPNGTVSSAKINESNWSDTSLGRQVESCIRERVQSWRFDQIDPSSGDITVNYSYVFSR